MSDKYNQLNLNILSCSNLRFQSSTLKCKTTSPYFELTHVWQYLQKVFVSDEFKLCSIPEIHAQTQNTRTCATCRKIVEACYF